MANYTSGKPEIPFNVTYFFNLYSCEYFGSSISSKGLFLNDDPLKHPLPLLLLQLGAVIITSITFQWLLKPFKQPRFVSDMLTGILFGPSILQYFGDGNLYQRLFNGKQATIMDVLELLSFSYFAFLVGVRTDMSMIKTSGKLAWVIGITAFAFPLALALPLAHYLGQDLLELSNSLNAISILAATTSFQVTSVLLEDLNLLNSEIGRLALSSSLISNVFGWTFKTISAIASKMVYFGYRMKIIAKGEISRMFLILFVLLVLRPIMFTIMKKIPEGSTMKESHLLSMTVMLFGVAFTAEMFGLQCYFGAMMLGFAVPAGPPLGSGLGEKLNLIVLVLLLPSYVVDAGRHVNLGLIRAKNYGLVELVIIVTYLGKLVASLVPSRYINMPYGDCFALGLILSSQGFFDVLLFKRALRVALLDEELYSILTVMTVLHAAMMTPLISYLYNPSKRYVNYRRRTIQHCRENDELRILVCIHEEEFAFSIMNLLKASYPTRERPIGVCVLDLMKLVGREHPLFINHQFHKRRFSKPTTRTHRIISAFSHYELHHEGMVKHQYFTAITLYASMHDDVCKLALDKSTHLLIIPSHKSCNNAVREVNKNILDKAPCSVGILIDKRIVTYFRSDLLNESKFHVCVIFSGGPDAREALAFGMRMAEYPDTRLTVIRLIAEDEFLTDLVEAKLDMRVIINLRSFCGDDYGIEYREVSVEDGVETSRVLLSLEENYDFILVGRRVDKESPLVSGLAEWSNDSDELGIIGDILASSDMKSKASVLVLQQQSTAEDLVKNLQ